jgi:hypothetical protein
MKAIERVSRAFIGIVVLAMLSITARAQLPGMPPVNNRQTWEGDWTKAYSGVIEITDFVTGPANWARETLRVTLTSGIAYCNGSYQSKEKSVGIQGSGLFQIFFQDGNVYKYDPSLDSTADSEDEAAADSKDRQKQDKVLEPVYSFVFACPPGPYGSPGPASWTDSHQSYNQPIPKSGAMKSCKTVASCSAMKAIAGLPPFLCGTWNIPNPASDPLNGVSGTLTLTWRLVRMGVPIELRVAFDSTAKDPSFPPTPLCNQ